MKNTEYRTTQEQFVNSGVQLYIKWRIQLLNCIDDHDTGEVRSKITYYKHTQTVKKNLLETFLDFYW